MSVGLREAIRAHVPLALIKQNAACTQFHALAKLFERPLPPVWACRAHSGSMPGVDSVDLRGCVVVIAVELVWISVWVLDGILLKVAQVSRTSHVGPCV